MSLSKLKKQYHKALDALREELPTEKHALVEIIHRYVGELRHEAPHRVMSELTGQVEKLTEQAARHKTDGDKLKAENDRLSARVRALERMVEQLAQPITAAEFERTPPFAAMVKWVAARDKDENAATMQTLRSVSIEQWSTEPDLNRMCDAVNRQLARRFNTKDPTKKQSKASLLAWTSLSILSAIVVGRRDRAAAQNTNLRDDFQSPLE